MDNIIRPAFGTKPEKPVTDPWAAVEVMGEAAGYFVGVARAADHPGRPLRVVMGKSAGTMIEPVALYPSDPEGESDAQACAMVILRALEIVERL